MTWIQMIIQFLSLLVLAQLGKRNPMFSFMPPVEFDIEIAKKVLPVTIFYISMMICNNLCLFYVEISFYLVARSLTIVFTIGIIYVLNKNKKPSNEILISCGILTLGYFITILTEISFPLSGIIFGLLSSLFASLYGISVNSVINELNDNTW